uniref:Uncharacterized protein n=1 Tax=Rhizophora mucronata TaxID=61149 RepID=A0A2P2NFW4_RHIMU
MTLDFVKIIVGHMVHLCIFLISRGSPGVTRSRIVALKDSDLVA